MVQKLVKVGNSYAVTIPKKFLDQLPSPEKALVNIAIDSKKKEIRLDFSEQELVQDVVDPEVYAVAKDLLRRYLPAFKELAKR